MIIREIYSYFYEIIGLHPVYIYFNESKEEKYKNSKTMHIYMTPCKEEDGVCFTFVLRSVKFSSKIDSFSFLIKCVSDNRRQRTSLDQKDCSLALTIDIYVAYYPLYGLSFCTTKSIQYSTFWTKFVSFFTSITLSCVYHYFKLYNPSYLIAITEF